MTDISRRDVLGGAIAAGTAGLAGCLDSFVEGNTGSSSDENDSSSDDDGSGDDDEQSAAEFDILDVDVETVEANCLTDEEAGYDIEIAGDVVDISGIVEAPNPCHEVAVDATADGTTLVVDIWPQADDDDVDCIQCVGSLSYETQIELSSDAVQEVDITHREESDAPTDDSIASSGAESRVNLDSVETLDTSCADTETTVDASVEEGLLSITGTTQAPNPCHAAEVSDITAAGDELQVTVDVESTLDEGGVCQECLGEVTYEIDLDLADAQFDSVTVEHPNGDSFSVDL